MILSVLMQVFILLYDIISSYVILNIHTICYASVYTLTHYYQLLCKCIYPYIILSVFMPVYTLLYNVISCYASVFTLILCYQFLYDIISSYAILPSSVLADLALFSLNYQPASQPTRNSLFIGP